MSDVTYGVVEERYVMGAKKRQSYGIAVYGSFGEIDEETPVVASIHDITNDRERVTKLVRQCNRSGLSPIHLRDVVEDFFSAAHDT